MLVVGLAHSHTSAIAKFLSDNGVIFDDVVDNLSDKLPYKKHENTEVLDWVKRKKNFINAPFPVKIAKAPDAVYFLDSIPDTKVIFCMRNISDLILSHMDKYGYTFMETFNKIEFTYEQALNSKHDVYFVPTERILMGDENEGRRLLKFCGIDRKPILHLLPLKTRKRSYKTYRLENFFWKLFRPKHKYSD